MATHRVGDLGVLSNEHLAGAVKHQHTLLLRRLHLDKRMLGRVTASQIASASLQCRPAWGISDHFLSTHAPVEEPPTASLSDVRGVSP